MDKLFTANARFAAPTFLLIVAGVSILTIVLFPLFTFLYQYPAFTSLLTELARDEAVGVAWHFAALSAEDDRVLDGRSLDEDSLDRIRRFERDARVVMLRIYSPVGEILYSSVGEEIGTVNQEPYFRAILAEKKPVAADVVRLGPSLEGKPISADVVEVYVPLVRGGQLLGVYEVYHDTGPGKGKLRRLQDLSSFVLFALAAVLLTGVLLSVRRGVRYLHDRERVLGVLKGMSLQDELTGFHNRRGFLVLAEQQLKIARREQRGMLLVSADVDGLKAINDRFGHHEGDQALKRAARVLRETFRESDIVCRMGGDEFVVLATDTPDSGAEVLLSRLEHSLERHNTGTKFPYPLSISAGVAPVDFADAATLDELLVRADRAMYERKRQKKGLAPPLQAPPRESA